MSFDIEIPITNNGLSSKLSRASQDIKETSLRPQQQLAVFPAMPPIMFG